jgi:hypothetical protein
MATKYTPEEIEHHLKYEVEMLNGSYALIDTIDSLLTAANAGGLEKQVSVNALKEDFCVHARALIEFFTDDRDNSASDFAGNYNIPPLQKNVIRKLNNQISHLMDCRTRDNAKKILDTDRAKIMRCASHRANRIQGFPHRTLRLHPDS